MLKTYHYPVYPYFSSIEQLEKRVVRHPVVIVGAGPVGLTAALDFAQRGIKSIVLDDHNSVSVGSRAVCYAKRSLEIWERLGCAAPMIQQGVTWNVGKVFFENDLRYQFDLLPEADHKMPAMINLQQYYLETFLVEACLREPLIELRWKHALTALEQHETHACLTIETPDGLFDLEAEWVIACDGANSDTRKMVGADFSGQAFQDRFLIADIVMKAEFPAERWFWFDPPFHRNQSVLLHKQSDDVWRIDFQLGWDADPVEEKKPENILPRLKAMLGEERDFELEWASIYQFSCRRIDQFRHQRVIFAGDCAHQVSPFGARGANSGVQDVDNLGWKLKLVLNGAAPLALLDSYHDERSDAADDNLLNSTRSTDFISPKSAMSRRFRNAVLELAEHHSFARPLVNSGRLSLPTPYRHSPLNTPDTDAFAGKMTPGTNCADAPILINGQDSWLLNQLGNGFIVLVFAEDVLNTPIQAGAISASVLRVGIDLLDIKGIVTERYDGKPGTTYLIRPDQYIAARWRSFSPAAISRALMRAITSEEPTCP
jgi:3-(3-hydroxy-phenyl)propionate hydroxylase